MSLLKHLDRVPPNLCRVLARDEGRALTNRQIAKRSGLSLKRVGEISKKKSWGSVNIRQATEFTEACGVDTVNQWRVRKYLLRREGPKMAHISRAPNKRYLLKLLNL